MVGGEGDPNWRKEKKPNRQNGELRKHRQRTDGMTDQMHMFGHERSWDMDVKQMQETKEAEQQMKRKRRRTNRCKTRVELER